MPRLVMEVVDAVGVVTLAMMGIVTAIAKRTYREGFQQRLPFWVIRVDFGMSAACPVTSDLGNAGCPVLPVGMSRSYWLCPGQTRNPARRANQNGLGKFTCPVPAAKIFYFARRANHF